ncbi:hypothetical protein LDENG_00267370 [Lucifuga dentata]|nr:hypothetical protein LDENG_00267370 [Lucifuga dentata]
MPLHGKVVVIKRSGGDGTEFPLTASCLFGRKPDCDIRIQLPQVSKEHCRIDLNENKEVILTNLSSVNPTRVNGEILQQSERLKHGDLITVIDRSFRFEYPPAPTPKKKSTGGKAETLKVLQDQQVGDVITETGERRIAEVSTDSHLKDGTNSDNIQRALEKTVEVESKEDDSLQTKTNSPFSDLYQMIKQSLDAKTPRKSAGSLLQTPTSRFYTPKAGSARKDDTKPAISTGIRCTPKRVDAEVSPEAEGNAEIKMKTTPKSAKKQRKSFQGPASEMPAFLSEEKPAEQSAKPEATPAQKRLKASPKRFTVNEVIDLISAEKSTTPTRRKSKEATPVKSAGSEGRERHFPKESPEEKLKDQDVLSEMDTTKNSTKKRASGEHAHDLPKPEAKKKRVSFGGHLSPELFDKRMPPASPLRKGATPRRSLCLPKPKLLRRASVIGLVKELEQEDEVPNSPKVQSSVKTRTPSPKKSVSAKSPSPGKKSTKFKTPSPKASPGMKSPKSRTPSPGKQSTKARSSSSFAKTPSPARGRSPCKDKLETQKTSKTPKTHCKSTVSVQPPLANNETPTGKRRSSPAVSTTMQQDDVFTVVGRKAKTSASSEIQAPTVQGRFSVSRISTPSPTALEDAVAGPAPAVIATPKLPLRRKSMKSASRKTPGMKSTVQVMRRSGISRVSMKVEKSWANIVKFGQTKLQVAAPPKRAATTKNRKKAAPKLQTPARKVMNAVSTGHADSPVTIVVGRAHKQKVVYPTGAAPRLVTNAAFFKKNMKMDEDLTGISEMFKTPVNERRKSVKNDQSATPLGGPASAIEASVLNTPEEPDEMMVSPLNVASAVKGGRYNSEAVKRLLHGDKESFVSENPSLEIPSDESSEQHGISLEASSLTTPKQKPKQQECLTGVKRIMKTPRQKSEPLEDLRGNILKTPKQKLEQQECLTGVKRIMKTPRQKAEPVEDLRGKLLATPKQKPKEPECLTGVKRIFKTPKQKAEPVEDLRVKLLKTPKAPKVADVSLDGVKELLKTPSPAQESVEDPAEMADMKTPNVKSSSLVCLTGIKRMMKTPKQKNAPVEDMVGIKRLMQTLREKGKPVEENFGIKRLMKSPRLKGNSPVADFEGLQELMEEPCQEPTDEPCLEPTDEPCQEPTDEPCLEPTKEALSNLTAQMETNEGEEQAPLDCGSDVIKEVDIVCEEVDVPCVHSEAGPSDTTDTVPQNDVAKEADANEAVCNFEPETVPAGGHDECESSNGMEISSQAAVDKNVPEEQPELEKTGKDTEVTADNINPDTQKKAGRGRRAKIVESKPTDGEQEAVKHLEDPVAVPSLRGRRGKKTEAAAPPTVRQSTRSRNAKSNENKDADLTFEANESLASKVAVKPKRGRNAKKASDDQPEMALEVANEALTDQCVSVHVSLEANDSTSPQKKAVLKSKRGIKPKQGSVEQPQPVPQQQNVTCAHIEAQPADIMNNLPQADPEKGDAKEIVSGKQLEDAPSGHEEKKSSDAMKTDPKAAIDESLPEQDAANIDLNTQKKSVRGRRAKMAESKADGDKQETAEHSEEPIVAPVRGRRGKKAESSVRAIRQITRGRNAKSNETKEAEPPQEENDAPAARVALKLKKGRNAKHPSDDQAETVPEKAAETKLVPESSTESDQTLSVIATQEENESTPPLEEAVLKPIRGRKLKQAFVDQSQPVSEKNEIMSDQSVIANAQPQQSISDTEKEKPRRGRKKHDSAEQNEVVEDTVVSKTTLQQSRVPTRGRRGRNIKQEEERAENDGEIPPVKTIKSQEPAEKSRRTRKAEKDTVEPGEVDTQSVEIPGPENTETPAVSSKVKRKRTTKKDSTKSSDEIPAELQSFAPVDKTVELNKSVAADVATECQVESTEAQDKPTQKPKWGRGRGNQKIMVDIDITAEVPEEKPEKVQEAEENNKLTRPNAPVSKPSRARRVKTSEKNEDPEVIPPKRVCRQTCLPLEETADTENTVKISAESAKGRRRAATKPTNNTKEVLSTGESMEDDVSAAPAPAIVKKRVKWTANFELYEITNPTPVKATRGRKSKLQDQDETLQGVPAKRGHQNTESTMPAASAQAKSKTANGTEEKDLSGNSESEPVRRCRRGAKSLAAEESKANVPDKRKASSKKGAGVGSAQDKAEKQPATRRSARK